MSRKNHLVVETRFVIATCRIYLRFDLATDEEIAPYPISAIESVLSGDISVGSYGVLEIVPHRS
jgi:hypothetical protein